MKILHTNDMHGTLSESRFQTLLSLRKACDIYFDTGDAIKTGNLGVPLKPEPVWPQLKMLDCTASVPGNRESHVVEGAFNAKLAGAGHPILCANLRRKDGSLVLKSDITLLIGGLRVGVFGVMVPMVTERMASRAASAFLWSQPIPAAVEVALRLRPVVDLLVCLSHIGHRLDLELAEKCPEVDVILGGHSHTVLDAPVKVGRTAICQGGSHNRFAGVYDWSQQDGLTGGLIDLAKGPPG